VRDETLDFAICRRAVVKLDSALAFHPLFRHDSWSCRRGHPLEKETRSPSLPRRIGSRSSRPPPAGRSTVFSQAGLSVPQQVIQCESYNTAIGLIAKTDMLGFLSRQALGESILRDFSKKSR